MTVRYVLRIALFLSALQTMACAVAHAQSVETFEDAVAFVNQHSQLVVLRGANGASIAVWPAMQGRVLTSAIDENGRSFGWINQSLIASGKVQQHINAVGGEDRLWLGPEGGQFSIFFAPGATFDLDHWFTPAFVDTQAFEVNSKSADSISLSKDVEVSNYSGTKFKVRIERSVQLLSPNSVWHDLGIMPVPGVKMVGYQSDNKLINTASEPMKKSTGLLSLWVLGQFNAAPRATIILPFRTGSEKQLGPIVKTDYFGAVPADRITIGGDAVFFEADSNYRSKLGISPRRSKGVIGSYDPEHELLTIVQYDQTPDGDYVNSEWAIQKDPYKGDVANCYNDGPPAPGKPQLGHFYELESSSPAVALTPHSSVSHYQRTIHIVGTEEQLDTIAINTLGVHLRDIPTSQVP